MFRISPFRRCALVCACLIVVCMPRATAFADKRVEQLNALAAQLAEVNLPALDAAALKLIEQARSDSSATRSSVVTSLAEQRAIDGREMIVLHVLAETDSHPAVRDLAKRALNKHGRRLLVEVIELPNDATATRPNDQPSLALRIGTALFKANELNNAGKLLQSGEYKAATGMPFDASEGVTLLSKADVSLEKLMPMIGTLMRARPKSLRLVTTQAAKPDVDAIGEIRVAQQSDAIPKRPIEIRVNASGKDGFRLDIIVSPIAPSTMKGMTAILKRMVEDGIFSRDSRVIIKADGAVRFVYVVAAIEAVQKARLNDINLAQQNAGTDNPRTTLTPTKDSTRVIPESNKPATGVQSKRPPKREGLIGVKRPDKPDLKDAPIAKFFGVSARANRVVFVVDGTGSMLDVLPFAISELKGSLSALYEKQSFAVLFYQGNKVIPMLQDDAIVASKANVKKAIAWLEDGDDFVPQGGGHPVNAMKKALAYKPDVVFLLGQGSVLGRGVTAVKQQDVLAAVKQANRDKVAINTIQLLYPDPIAKIKGRRSTLEMLALENGGVYKFVSARELGVD